MNLIELLCPSFRGKADKPAICFNGQAWTFGRIDADSTRVAAALRDRFALAKGDRAAMYLSNCIELLLYYLACLKLGAIVVPMNPLYRDRELSHLLVDCEPKVILTDHQGYELLQLLRREHGFIQTVFMADGAEHDETISFNTLSEHKSDDPISVAHIGDHDPALMLYTSGTTGRSKGAVLTHDNLTSNIIALLYCWQWTEHDRFVLALPLFHAHGLCNGFHGAMASGCTTFLFERFKAEPVLDTLRRHDCTLLFGVPTMYERLLEAADAGAAVPDPAAMRLYVSGSAPLSPDTFARFARVFGHEIVERYGMSETLMITSNLYAGARGQGTVGTPLPGVSVRLVTQEGLPVYDLQDSGEIQVKGPNVLKEYWKQPDKTAESFDDGWFKTGDVGRWDDQGRLVICGRQKELIISGGFNVYPQELINCLCDHPGVAQAAVIGVPDQRRGELVKAYVVTTDDQITEQSLIEHCRSHLASFKVPRRVVFIDQLPRNAMGKIQLQNLPERDRL